MRWALLLTACLLAGCGTPGADLFEVVRTGADRNANLTLLVTDDGSVTCNGKRHEVPGETLLEARELTRALSEQAELNLSLPPGSNPVLTYRVRMESGTISFSDTSRPMPESCAQLTAFTKHVGEDVCGLARG
jgi:hypothetical protein